MSSNMKKRAPLVLTLSVVVAAVLTVIILQPAHAEKEGGSPGGSAHYTVVMTEGHNLVVTDNASNKLYFYTIDKNKEIGSELKLRGSVDLSKVGEPEIKPTSQDLQK